MMMGVGFIVGWEISLLVFLGGAISFLGAIPLLALGADLAAGPTTDVLLGVWDSKIRFFGIGAMVVAGIYSIVKIAPSMGAALRTAAGSIGHREDAARLERTERGISGLALFLLLLVVTAIQMPVMTGWLERGWEVDAISVAAFLAVTYLLYRRAEGPRGA